MIKIISDFISRYEIYFGFAVCIIFFGAGIYICHVFHEAALTRQFQAQIDDHAKKEKDANDKATALEKQLADLRMQNIKLNESIKNETKKAAYSCVLPESGKLLINQAIAGISTR